jgi:hypothetical protein
VDSLTIRCECGATISAPAPDELVAAANAHMAAEHPGLAGVLTPDQWLAMAETRHEDERERAQ